MAKRKDDDGKFKGAFEHEPQAKGGRTGATNNRNHNPNFMQNLKPWKPGESGNPPGTTKSAQEIQRMAREMTPRVLEVFFELLNNPEIQPRDRIMAGIYIADRGCGKPPVLTAITGEIAMGNVTVAEAEGVTALLARARLEKSRSIEAKPDEE